LLPEAFLFCLRNNFELTESVFAEFVIEHLGAKFIWNAKLSRNLESGIFVWKLEAKISWDLESCTEFLKILGQYRTP